MMIPIYILWLQKICESNEITISMSRISTFLDDFPTKRCHAILKEKTYDNSEK